MTTHELAKLLFNKPNIRVVIDGYEGGYEDIKEESLLEIKIRLNMHTEWYYGKHDSCNCYEEPCTCENMETVINISR